MKEEGKTKEKRDKEERVMTERIRIIVSLDLLDCRANIVGERGDERLWSLFEHETFAALLDRADLELLSYRVHLDGMEEHADQEDSAD